MVKRPQRHEGGRGQALVEFALVVPVFMLLIGGVIQFGIWFWDQNTLNQLVRDAGRYAATVKDCSPASKTDIENKIQLLKDETPFSGTWGAVTVTLPTTDPPSDPCPANTNKEVVWVSIKVEATVPAFFPLINGAIASTATYRMEPQAK